MHFFRKTNFVLTFFLYAFFKVRFWVVYTSAVIGIQSTISDIIKHDYVIYLIIGNYVQECYIRV